MRNCVKKRVSVLLAIFMVLSSVTLFPATKAEADAASQRTSKAVATSPSAASVTYYVDAALGDDENDGLSPDRAWKTLDKVNNTSYSPGISILFKRGQAWAGNLIVSSSGAPGNEITYGAYGTGAKPIINGTGEVRSAAVLIRDKSYVTVRGLAVTNLGVKAGTNIPNDMNELGRNEALRSGFMLTGTRGVSTVLQNIHLIDNEIYNVKGTSERYPAGGVKDDMYHNAGIFVYTEKGTGASSLPITRFDGLSFEGNYIHDNSNMGIVFNTDDPHTYNSKPETYHTNVVIKDNTIHRVGADAIIVGYSEKPLIEGNIAYDAGSKTELGRWSVIAGVWLYNTNDAVFQYNETARTRFAHGDAMAYDADWGTSGTLIYQYNYSHENYGGMMMDCTFAGSENLVKQIYRYNLSVNEPGNKATLSIFYKGKVDFYNNTVYVAPGGGRILIQDQDIPEVRIFNNIFAADAIDYGDSNKVFANNLISRAAPPEFGRGNMMGDPRFEDTSAAAVNGPIGSLGGGDRNASNLIVPGSLDGWSNTEGFRIQGDSPAINNGLFLADNGGRDLYQNSIHDEKPDIGAHEFQGSYTGGAVTRVPINALSSIQAELYDNADLSNSQVEELDSFSFNQALTNLQNGDMITFNHLYTQEAVENVQLKVKGLDHSARVKLFIDDDEYADISIPASDHYQTITEALTHELPPKANVSITLQVVGDTDVALVDLDHFNLAQKVESPYEVPYKYTFTQDTETWVPVKGDDSVELFNGTLLTTSQNNPAVYTSVKSPIFQDGIVEAEITPLSNERVSLLLRYDEETENYIEIGLDTGTYWFVDSRGLGLNHSPIISSSNPVIESGKTYKVKAKISGQNIKVYVNDVQLLDQTFHDLTLSSGKVGLRKWNGGKASIDNVRVNAAVVKGQVKTSDGVPLPGAVIRAEADGALVSTTTDEAGNYRFDTLALDKLYILTASVQKDGNSIELPKVTVTPTFEMDVRVENFEVDGSKDTKYDY